MIFYKVWWRFEREVGEQLSFDFYEQDDEWIGPFWYASLDLDSENTLKELYNTDSKNNRNFKITGKF